MGGSGGALLSAGPLHCQSLPRRAHVARLHGSARKGHLQGMQHRSRRGYGLEEVPQSSADGQPLLVLLGYGVALLPELAAAQPRRQRQPDPRLGVQHLHLVHGQLQLAALQRRDGSHLFYAVVRHHALPVHHRSVRHGRHGRHHEGAGSEDHEGHRQLLGLSGQEHDPYPDAPVASGRYPAGDQRHPDVVRRQTDHHDARRPGAGHLARPHGRYRADQTAGYQRRRLFRRQLFAPARKSQRLHEYVWSAGRF